MKLGRFFDSEEFRCRCGRPDCDAPLMPDLALVALLDALRDAVKAPLTITSGLRCKVHNEALNGEPFSGHLNGTEADISCPTSRFRDRLLGAAYSLGVSRKGIYPRHLHFGIRSKTLPNDVTWVG